MIYAINVDRQMPVKTLPSRNYYLFICIPDICRICLNQKCVLKRHQQKVHESQMNYARIIGDKQLEDELKRKYRGEYMK